MSFSPVLDAALVAQAACEALDLKGCVIGGVALQRWGEEPALSDELERRIRRELGHP